MRQPDVGREQDRILAENAGLSVFLFSNRGPDGPQQLVTPTVDLSSERILDGHRVLLAMRTADSCTNVGADVTLANAIRRFTGCVFDLDVPSLRDRSFVVPCYDRGEEMIEISSETPDDI